MSEYIYATDGDTVQNMLSDVFEPLQEVVRCRDCKHYTDDEFGYRHYCNEWCGQVEPDDFCAWALERK